MDSCRKRKKYVWQNIGFVKEGDVSVDIIQHSAIVYGSKAEEQRLEVYRPRRKAGELLPVIVRIHDGVERYDDRNSRQHYCVSLAQNGFAVVNYIARPVSESLFSYSLENINMVFGWVLAHAAEYKLDTSHIFAVGDFAGAYQLGVYCNYLTNSRYAAKFAFTPPKKFILSGIVLNSGAYLPAPDQLDDAVNVPGYVTKNFPPVFVMVRDGELLIEQALYMVRTLVEKKVPHEFFIYGNAEMKCGECDFFRSLFIKNY
jgi:acetyl esterase/lipase